MLVTSALGCLGLAGRLADAWERARARLAATDLSAGTVAAALADELVPSRAGTRLRAIERERRRLADELHADVLPDLSTAIREIEAGASPDDATRRLREITAGLRALMDQRRPAALEELGLVPALEWLAERVQGHTGVPVELDITRAARDDPEARPPRDVELAVYRIAQQALDNALLHARPRRVHLQIDMEATLVDLTVADDGAGIPQMAGVIRVAIVDDHPATASGLAALLAREPDLQVVGTAGTLPEAAELCAREGPDVALVDIQLGGEPAGFELLRQLAQRGGPKAILFSSYECPGFHARAIELGARGYLAKTASLAEIVAALRSVAAGGAAFTANAITDAGQAPRPPSDVELQIIRLLAPGFTNDEIGARLGLTEKSVESRLRRLFSRYGVASRTELSFLAVQQGWIGPDLQHGGTV